jgi:hypothetical protein
LRRCRRLDDDPRGETNSIKHEQNNRSAKAIKIHSNHPAARKSRPRAKGNKMKDEVFFSFVYGA